MTTDQNAGFAIVMERSNTHAELNLFLKFIKRVHSVPFFFYSQIQKLFSVRRAALPRMLTDG